jgi:hypothetical protein
VQLLPKGYLEVLEVAAQEMLEINRVEMELQDKEIMAEQVLKRLHFMVRVEVVVQEQ